MVGVGINTFLSPNISGYKTSSLKDYSKKRLNNGIILKDIKKTYEKFLDEIKKYRFSYLMRNYSKLKNELPGRRHRKHTCKNIYLK